MPKFDVDINPNADCSALDFHNSGTGEVDVNIHEFDSDEFVSHDLPAGADVTVPWETFDIGTGEFGGLLIEVVVVTPGNANTPPGYQLNDGLIRKDQECPEPGLTFTVRYECDDFQSASGWVRMLAVGIVRSRPAEGLMVSVSDGTTAAWEELDGFLGTEDILVGWPSTGSGRDQVFADSFSITVRAANGTAVFAETFTKETVAAEGPSCLPLFSPPPA